MQLVKWGVLAILVTIFAPLALSLPKAAHDLPQVFPDSIIDGWRFPQTWSDALGLGNYAVPTLWSWPVTAIISGLTTLGLSPTLLLPGLTLGLGLALAWVGIGKLLEAWGIQPVSQHIARLVYLTNSYFLLLVDGGQITVALAYCLLPLSFFLFLRAINTWTLKNVLGAVAGVVGLSIADLRILYLLGILLAIHTLFHLRLLSRILLLGIICGLFLSGWHAYWLLPSVLSQLPTIPLNYGGSEQLSFLNFATLGHSLLLQQPHWPANIFGQISGVKSEFIVWPILAFATMVFTNNRIIKTWLVVAIIAILLSKGSNPPGGELYTWAFNHVPGMVLFRDTTKFFFLTALTYSLLIAWTTQTLTRKFKSFPWLVVGVGLISLLPLVQGQMTGILSTPRNKTGYQQVGQMLAEDHEFGRVLWVPKRGVLGFTSPLHRPLEANQLVAHSFVSQTVGAYETLNFLREGKNIDKVLDMLGVKYLIYPPLDPKYDQPSVEEIDYHRVFWDQLRHLPWVKELGSGFNFGILTTTSHQHRFFMANNPILVMGDESVYSPMHRLSEAGLIFAEQKLGTASQTLDLPGLTWVSQGKSELDLGMSFVRSDRVFFPADQLSPQPDAQGWWKRSTSELLWWRDFLQQKYQLNYTDWDFQGGWAVAEGETEHNFTYPNLQTGQILLARVLLSNKGGGLTFTQGGKEIGSITTRQLYLPKSSVTLSGLVGTDPTVFNYDSAPLRWFRIGPLVESNDLTVSASGSLNVLNALATVPPQELEQLTAIAAQIPEAEPSAGVEDAVVSYERLAPTHYRVTVSNLNQPGILAFNDQFNPLWQASGAKSLPLYGMINGFPISSQGTYDVYFSAQAHADQGLVITGITALLFLGLSLRVWKTK